MASFRRFRVPAPNARGMIETVPVPELEEDEVLSRVLASSVQATDCYVRSGLYPKIGKRSFPLTTGYDFVGRVEAVGSAVSEFKVGDRVADMCLLNAHAELIVSKQVQLLKIPPELDDIDDAEITSLMLSWITAYQMLFRAGDIKSTDSILIQGGSGATGRPAISLALAAGAKVYATTGSAEQIAVLEAAGVTKAYDYHDPLYPSRLVKDTNGGVDKVFDGIGENGFESSRACLRKNGKLIIYGMHSRIKVGSEKEPSFASMACKMLGARIFAGKQFTFYSVTDMRKSNPQFFRDDLALLMRQLLSEEIQVEISRRIQLEDIEEVHGMLKQGGVVGKVVLVNPTRDLQEQEQEKADV